MEGSAGSVGRIMAPLLGVPERHHADYGRLGLAFQHANFVRDVAEDYGLDRIYLPAGGPRALRRRRGGLRRARAPRPSCARSSSTRSPARAACSPPPARPSPPRPPRCGPGIRLACAVYESVLDRVEAAGYDVLGRRMGVRLWRLPLLAFGALRP